MAGRAAVGASWPPSDDVRRAVAPRWADGTVTWLELTLDQVFTGTPAPDFARALDAASAAGRLVGHGVMASPYTCPRDAVARAWMAKAKQVLRRWPVQWLTDHIGCARAAGWHAAPLPLPPSRALVRHVQDHLAWLSGELEVPVGLENLALACSQDDVLHQPELLEAMLAPVDGVLLLDLHNLWCGAVNYGLDPVALLERYPLERVVELHIAGGRWGDDFRRDTHDGPVPAEVWALLPEALARCPQLKVVVWERLPGTLSDAASADAELLQLADALGSPAAPTPVGHALPSAGPWPEWSPAQVQEALFAAARSGERSALDAAAPGWWRDDRAWRVAVDITARWGRSVPH